MMVLYMLVQVYLTLCVKMYFSTRFGSLIVFNLGSFKLASVKFVIWLSPACFPFVIAFREAFAALQGLVIVIQVEEE